MKHLSIIFTVCLIFSLKSAHPGEIHKVYEFQDPGIERTGAFSLVYFEGCRLYGEPGKATLPFYPVKLLLPPGEVAVTVDITFEEEVVLPGNYTLLPRQRIRPLSDTTKEEWLADEMHYRSVQKYPGSRSPGVSTHHYHGYPIATSSFTPIQYVPSTGQVSYFRRVVVTVQTAPARPMGGRHGVSYPSFANREKVKELVQNPEGLNSFGPLREFLTSDYDYLVVTQNQFISSFDTLISFYLPRGIRTKAFSTEYIQSNMTGADLQEKIRNLIIQEYEDHGISNVLIGGDVDVVPYRGFYCYVQSGGGYASEDIPADLYYSALDGNWNTDGDNRWGEPGEDDLYPEVGVGRMSFSTAAELQKMLHKTFSYQANPVTGELTHPLLAGEHLWSNPLTYGSDYMRLLVGFRTDHGYSTQGIPDDHPVDSLYDAPGYTYSKSQIIAKINSGKPWIHHCGHANQNYVMRLYSSDITNANFSGVNGVAHNYPVVYTHGCNCGAFDYSDCIAEKMVGIDHFAVAFIGNSRYGWFVEGTTDGPSQHLHREFMDALYRDSLYHLGQAHLQSKLETAPFVDLAGEYEPGATRWCFYDNNLLGDPVLAAWTQEPWTVETQYPRLIPIGTDSVHVQLTGPFGPCKGFTCSIFRNNTLFGKAFSDESGQASVPLEGFLTEGPVSLIVSGYNILPAYFELDVSDYWLGHTSDWGKGFNWYSGQVPDSNRNVIIPEFPVGTYFPTTNSLPSRECRAILIEPGAIFTIGSGETFTILSN